MSLYHYCLNIYLFICYLMVCTYIFVCIFLHSNRTSKCPQERSICATNVVFYSNHVIVS